MKITEEIVSFSLSAKNGDFEDGDNADNFMGWGPLGIFLYQMRYSGRCSVFYIELILEDID